MNDNLNSKTIENPGELSSAERKQWLDLYTPLDHQSKLKVIYLLIDQLHKEPAITGNEAS